jgi:hypothetical protein
MGDFFDRITEVCADIALYSCVAIAYLVASSAMISVVYQALTPKEPRAAQVTTFENFCDPEWKALEKYGARVNCYRE